MEVARLQVGAPVRIGFFYCEQSNAPALRRDASSIVPRVRDSSPLPNVMSRSVALGLRKRQSLCSWH